MDWFKDLYDDFRMRTGFGSIPEEQTKKEVDFLCRELGLSSGSNVLDLFCGPGRHCIELAKRGITAIGIEYNANYIAKAEERAQEASVASTFIQGDVRDISFGGEYDAVIIMYQSFGYFTNSQDKEILKKVYFSLKDHGRFFIEILNRDYILRNFKEKEEKIVEGIKVLEERQFDILNSRVNSTITRFEEGGPVVKNMSWRLYSPHEIKNILESIGFIFLVGYSSLNRDPISLDTRLMRLIWEKNKC